MLEKAGRIDFLVNNAGLSSFTPGIDISDTELRMMFGMWKDEKLEIVLKKIEIQQDLTKQF